MISPRLVLAAACAFLPAVAADAPPTRHKGDVTGVRVVRRVEKHPDAWRLWQPYLAQWNRRTMVVAFGAMVAGKKDMGSILSTATNDDGATWTEPVPIFDYRQRQGAIQFGYANPVLFKPPGQEVLWCFAMRCPIQYENSEESHLVGAFTADGGKTWTQVEMAMDYSGPLILNAGVHPTAINGQKRYLLPAHRNTLQKDPLGSRDHFVLSSTSLLEWKLESFIPQPAKGPKVFLHEGNIAPWDDSGAIKMVMRTAGYEDAALTTNPPRAYSSLSRDGGKTWSPAEAEPDLYNAKSKGYFGRASDGSHIYVYNDGAARERMALRYKVRPKGGAWSAEKTFYDAGIKNSYPTLLEVAPGEFRAVWDSGTASEARTHIQYGALKIHP